MKNALMILILIPLGAIGIVFIAVGVAFLHAGLMIVNWMEK